jgi:hypothetical protein
MNQTILEQYMQVISSNDLYQRNQRYWDFLLNSYMGGVEYQRSANLTKYLNETSDEYWARVGATHYENHCKSVIATYTSFLFRTNCERDLGNLANDPMVEEFLKDCDMDGRSFQNFMKETAVWSSVFGHCWIIVAKPNVGAATLADERTLGARPYVSMLTPLTVFDWQWYRDPSGKYRLVYLKYAEEANDTFSTIKEWTEDMITTYVVDHKNKMVKSTTEEINQLGSIPAVLAYNHRSPVRGIGVSDIADISMAAKFIYNLTSEVEQSVRINGHPALVKTAGTEAMAGAGAIIQMEDNMDPGLKPYMLTVSTDTNSIYSAINHTVTAIDKMANTGSIRSTEATRMSGVAQEQEFQLLNAKLSEKADNLELTEEQIWRWFALYQGVDFTGNIEYPCSFNIRDQQAEITQLKTARETATDPRVIREIDRKIIEWMGLDPEEILNGEVEEAVAGRTYENGEAIDPRLPEAYRNATGEAQQCENCRFYNPETFACSQFGGAPVRPMWVCAVWQGNE